MNFNEIKNRLLIGALAITVFPFYVHAQNDKMEGQTAHKTKDSIHELHRVGYRQKDDRYSFDTDSSHRPDENQRKSLCPS